MLETLIKLDEITNLSSQEWIVIQQRCKDRIGMRLKHKDFGAHSELRLGKPAFDFYFTGAVEKILTEQWELKYPIIDQICRIMGSMISDEVRKFRGEQENVARNIGKPIEDIEKLFESPPVHLIDSLTQEFDLPETIERIYNEKYERLKENIRGDRDLESFFELLVNQDKKYPEIREINGWTQEKLYSITQKLKRRIKSQ